MKGQPDMATTGKRRDSNEVRTYGGDRMPVTNDASQRPADDRDVPMRHGRFSIPRSAGAT